jgi:hypothetical protein
MRRARAEPGEEGHAAKGEPAIVATPAAGMNLRETISEALKRENIPHSMADARAAAQTLKRRLKLQDDDDVNKAAGRGERLMAPSSALSTAEIALHQERLGKRGTPASVKLVAGRVASREVPHERLDEFSAEHFAPPTSTRPGTAGVRPKENTESTEPDDDSPPNKAASGEPMMAAPSPRALGNEAAAERGEDEGRKAQTAGRKQASEALQEAKKRAAAAEDEKETRSVSTADMGEKGIGPTFQERQAAVRRSMRESDKATERELAERAERDEAENAENARRRGEDAQEAPAKTANGRKTAAKKASADRPERKRRPRRKRE